MIRDTYAIAFMPEYTTGKHQDPHEFMIKALTALKGCLLEYNNLIDLTFRGAVVKQVCTLILFFPL